MDNRIFNVNGTGLEMLRKALELVFIQEGFQDKPATAKGWTFDPKKGLVLIWHVHDAAKSGQLFPIPLTANDVAPIVWNWLKSNEAKNMPLEGWDIAADHDGDNEYGWRVYVEDWGHVGDHTYSICAVTPSYAWMGK